MFRFPTELVFCFTVTATILTPCMQDRKVLKMLQFDLNCKLKQRIALNHFCCPFRSHDWYQTVYNEQGL